MVISIMVIVSDLGLQVDPSGGHPIAQADTEVSVDLESESWDTDEEDPENLECYPKGAPSLLESNYYVAAQGSRVILGATRRKGLTADEAFQVSL